MSKHGRVIPGCCVEGLISLFFTGVTCEQLEKVVQVMELELELYLSNFEAAICRFDVHRHVKIN